MSDEQPKVCNWCNKLSKLGKGKKSCATCISKAFRTCKRCQKPYNSEDYFQLDDKRCNACQRKYINEKTKRASNKRSKSLDKSHTSPSRSVTDAEDPVKVSIDKINENSSDDDCMITLYIPAKISKRNIVQKGYKSA